MINIQTFGVIGAGQMGAGIAQSAAQSGLNVVLVDLKEEFVQRAVKTIEKSLAKLAEKGKVQNPAEVQKRIRVSTQMNNFAECDFVVEAVTENEPIKFQIFSDLDKICRPDVVLATNTSSISITRLAGKTRRPSQVIGMHFMNPVPMMELVEIIRGLQTSDATYQQTRGLAEKMGKTTVLSKDSAGFIVNRILVPMINEAIYALHQGIGTVEDIDNAMKLGTHQPMGPLALAD
ncbi:MAG: 3-hydroxybutyryl-CoA dehydrogenase, partial [Deltaproteobacteria bacterium]|nr:3-hydroxybutyryl-CoA dehydrogenase [Deltaproteobacteria bacterium]